MSPKETKGPHTWAKVTVDNVEGRAQNYGAAIFSTHSIFISNPSADHDMNFTYTYQLCAKAQDCSTATYAHILHPGEIYTESKRMNYWMQARRDGYYIVSGYTNIRGEYNEDASGQGSVWIH